jgi:DNA-binding GntR family transcriptional regulator
MVRFQYCTILAAGRRPPAAGRSGCSGRSGHSGHSLVEHEMSVEAVVARDADGAERAMRAHLGNVAQALHERAHAETVAAG